MVSLSFLLHNLVAATRCYLMFIFGVVLEPSKGTHEICLINRSVCVWFLFSGNA